MAEPTGTNGVASEGRGASWGIAVALVLLALLLLLAVARRQPPDPRPQDAPATEFSAGRAREVLRELLGDGRPHPVGSEANVQVRDRILARLRGLGYAPEVQEGFACRPECARVENVLARLEGSQPTGTILLMAHYDSVAAGPGASDDTAGVAAVLEVARVLKAGPPPKNTVLFLLDDGEEQGLLGARVFAESPAARDVKVVVNLEARGSSGPSLMFETSGDDGWLIPLYAAGASHPTTSSVFATIYDLMPNDTDLTIFKQRGVHGLNFAYVGNPTHYHTALDNFENASPASLQHHGDNALAAVRGLAGADLASPPPGDAVFFDVLGTTVVHWPQSWTLGIAALALVLVLAVIVLGFRRRLLTGGGVSFGLLAFLGSVLLAGVVAFGLTTLLRATPTPWVAKPLPVIASFWLLALAITGFVVASLAGRAGRFGLWAGIWLGWAVFGLLLALSAPGLSYLFLIPTIVAGLAGLFAFRPESGATTFTLAALLPLLVAAILWFPILTPLYDGLGTGGSGTHRRAAGAALHGHGAALRGERPSLAEGGAPGRRRGGPGPVRGGDGLAPLLAVIAAAVERGIPPGCGHGQGALAGMGTSAVAAGVPAGRPVLAAAGAGAALGALRPRADRPRAAARCAGTGADRALGYPGGRPAESPAPPRFASRGLQCVGDDPGGGAGGVDLGRRAPCHG